MKMLTAITMLATIWFVLVTAVTAMVTAMLTAKVAEGANGVAHVGDDWD